MTIDEMKRKLEHSLTAKRYLHSLNVMQCAIELANRHGADASKAAVAGLLHDCARDFKINEIFKLCEINKVDVDEINRAQPELLHAPLGAEIASKEYGVDDMEILDSIRYHTTGRENMSILEKIIFVADYIEPGRNFPGVAEIRRSAWEDIDRTMIMALDKTIKFVISKGALIHPLTIKARNYMIFNRKCL